MRLLIGSNRINRRHQATGVVSSQLVGGLNDERAADERIRNVVQSVRPDFERRYEHEISSLEPLSYRTQVVSGMNYFVKVSFGRRV